MVAHPDQLWINGAAQGQVGSIDQVKQGDFFLDEKTSTLYVGSDPTGKQITASNLQYAVNVRAAGVTIRGIGFRHFAPSVWQMGAITLEEPDATLENVVMSESATTGISVQATGVRLDRVTVDRSGLLGITARFADGLVMTRVLAQRNNAGRFNYGPVSAGVKIGATSGVKVADSAFRDNRGAGIWEDLSVYDSVISGSDFTGNATQGLFLEISAKAVVADSVFADNGRYGLEVNNTSGVKIWNNTFVGNGRPLDLVQDSRRNTNPQDQAVDPRQPFPDPTMPWRLESINVSNNVVALPNNTADCLLRVEDYTGQQTAEAMKITANGNLYERSSTSTPTLLAVWSRGKVGRYEFKTLSALQSTTGQETRGRESIGTGLVNSAGVLSASGQAVASQIALPLPADIAQLIGKPTGTVALGAWA